jgi:hypothetical protein
MINMLSHVFTILHTHLFSGFITALAAQTAPAEAPSPALPLAEISTGEAVSFWPLAWGWWVIIALFVVAFIVSGAFAYRYAQQRKIKWQALKALKQIKVTDENSSERAHNILRAVCLAYYPADNVGALSGKAWHSFLINKVSDSRITDPILQLEQSLYREHKTKNELPLNALRALENWIEKAIPPKGASDV